MVTEPELLEDLKWLGFNMLSCANSHSLNFGEAGLLLQNQYLDAAGIAHAGTGENLRQASSSAYLDTPNGRVALIAATAHLPSEQNRAAHQRFDFPGKPGVNPLGFETTFVVDRESFAALRQLGASLGFDRQRQRVADHGFHTEGEIGAATITSNINTAATATSSAKLLISAPLVTKTMSRKIFGRFARHGGRPIG
jgi:Bacterial capsule synthesis protein PGA_cap